MKGLDVMWQFVASVSVMEALEGGTTCFVCGQIALSQTSSLTSYTGGQGVLHHITHISAIMVPIEYKILVIDKR